MNVNAILGDISTWVLMFSLVIFVLVLWDMWRH